jgi:hypothetical protein
MAATPRARLVLTLMSDGSLTVEGPTQDKLACYAMLELGRDAIKDAHDQTKQLIQPVHLSAIPNKGT